MKRVVHYSQAEARDFFERLATYSAEYVRVAIPQIHPRWPSQNFYRDWRSGHPIGNLLHWTGGVSYAGTIRHFVLGQRASSHWIVGKALDHRFDELRRNLDLDRALRAEVCQVVSPDRPSWHGGWVNRFLTGIEIRNAGVLRAEPKGKALHPVRAPDFFKCGKCTAEELNFFWWPNGWTTPFSGEVVNVRGAWHETWSRSALSTVITLLRHLDALYPGDLDPLWMLAHHNVEKTKSDIILPLPLHLLRQAVLFSEDHVDDLDWLAEHFDDVEERFEDHDDPYRISELDARQADRAEEDLTGFDPEHKPGRVEKSDEVHEGLERLGFFLGESDEDSAALERAVRIYQRGRGLDVDGKAGPATRAALERDLRAWRIG